MVIAKIKEIDVPNNKTNTMKKNMDYNMWKMLGEEPHNNQNIGFPRAVFIPHSNSLPFEERHITLEQPVKIGRNVYRATPSPTNTIFECRVLSRHHATLYYDKGHFYLVDNKSSNGTFINSMRCSVSSQSEPHEVFSGDVVQFGIPVVENTSNSEKNMFPPVVALLKLYHPDGNEAKLSYDLTMQTSFHLKELYELNKFIQEALQRETSLKSRIRMLQRAVEQTREEAQTSWELFVGEQRLLTRVHTLETMLSVGKQPDADHIAQLLNDKRNYQEVAQESLRVAHEQRLVLQDALQRSKHETAALRKCNHELRDAADLALHELQELAARCERKICAARLAISAAEERESLLRSHLPLTYSIQNGEAKMLVLSSDTNRLQDTKRNGSLEDAVLALPDYIKLLLPQNVLNKMGIMAISVDGKSPKEFELILNKNIINAVENKEKQGSENSGVGVSGEEKSLSADICTDDEKQSRLNHDASHEAEMPTMLDGELHDDNANSTFTEAEIREDSPTKGGVEYANLLRVMAGLNEEIKALRERLSASVTEGEHLRSVRDELLAAQPLPHREPPTSTVLATVPLPAPICAPPDSRDCAGDTQRQAELDELQDKLMNSMMAEAARSAEIDRLTANIALLEAELGSRPTRDELNEIKALNEQLRAELFVREPQAEMSNKGQAADEIDLSAIAAELDNMFRLDEDDDSDSVPTEFDSRLDDEARLQVTMQNGALHALEEELVRAKERWALESTERARLAAQLELIQRRGNITSYLIVAVPLFAFLIYLLLPLLS